MLTARNVMLTRMSATHGPVGRDVKEGIDGDVFSRLVAYSSDQVIFCLFFLGINVEASHLPVYIFNLR